MKWSDERMECIGDFLVTMLIAFVSLAQKFLFARVECNQCDSSLPAVRFSPVQPLHDGPVIWSLPRDEPRGLQNQGALAMRQRTMRWV